MMEHTRLGLALGDMMVSGHWQHVHVCLFTAWDKDHNPQSNVVYIDGLVE